jgi:hypothetical protein
MHGDRDDHVGAVEEVEDVFALHESTCDMISDRPSMSVFKSVDEFAERITVMSEARDASERSDALALTASARPGLIGDGRCAALASPDDGDVVEADLAGGAEEMPWIDGGIAGGTQSRPQRPRDVGEATDRPSLEPTEWRPLAHESSRIRPDRRNRKSPREHIAETADMHIRTFWMSVGHFVGKF